MAKKSISIVIMAHPSRYDWAIDLAKKLKAEIVWDQHNNIWDTARRSWLAHDMAKDWAITIQDDAIVCHNFRKLAAEHIARADEMGAAIQFYAGSGKWNKDFAAAVEKGHHVMRDLCWGVAIAMRTDLIADMVRFGDGYDAWQDDVKIKYFLRSRKIPTYYPIPCLVDHRRIDENKTLTKCKDSDRFSEFFIGSYPQL